MKLLPLLLLLSVVTTGQTSPLSTCVDFHCDHMKTVVLSSGQWREIHSLFEKNETPQKERDTIAKAIALFEQLIGPLNGTAGDLAKNTMTATDHGQLDCISESINTSHYLKALDDRDLLRWHRPAERIKRQRWLFAIHWSAVIEEIASGKGYVVDSWYGKNGDLPIIISIEKWLQNELD